MTTSSLDRSSPREGTRTIYHFPVARPSKVYTAMELSKMTETRRRRVTFGRAAEVHEIPTVENAHDLWYSEIDYKRISNRNKICLLKMMGHPRVRSITLHDETTFGLEWQLPRMRKQREQRHRAAVSVVLTAGTSHPLVLETDRSNTKQQNSDKGSSNGAAESIAVVYGLLSESYAEAAVHRARRVAMDVQKVHGDDDDVDINVDNPREGGVLPTLLHYH